MVRQRDAPFLLPSLEGEGVEGGWGDKIFTPL